MLQRRLESEAKTANIFQEREAETTNRLRDEIQKLHMREQALADELREQKATEVNEKVVAERDQLSHQVRQLQRECRRLQQENEQMPTSFSPLRNKEEAEVDRKKMQERLDQAEGVNSYLQ